ncbi:putative primosome PriB/single-strand DNA-binding, nucleic acid-binding protein [Dioscorea sansibarensis]
MSFDELDEKNKIEDDDFLDDKRDSEPQGVDPKRVGVSGVCIGWSATVTAAIICGKIGQALIQKFLKNGKTVTIFTVGTGGMFNQRIVGAENLRRPAQWHRIVVHNEHLGAYNNYPSVFVGGNIETRVYKDNISGQIKNAPEICVRREGMFKLLLCSCIQMYICIT